MPFTSEQIARALDAKAKGLTLDDLARVGASIASVQQKLAEFPPSLKASQARAELLLILVTDPNATFEARKLAAGALLYLSSPLDLVPDHEPGGYSDDAAVVDLAAQRVAQELRASCERAGLSTAPFDI